LNLGDKQLRKALATSYRRVRATAREALDDPSHEETFHDLRKRLKELRYQVELLRPRSVSPEPLASLADLAEALGEVTDLFVLRGYIRTHRQALGPCRPEPLLARIDQQAEAKTAIVLEKAKVVVAPKAKAYVRSVLGPKG
jgi:CHAD domain-containing protein